MNEKSPASAHLSICRYEMNHTKQRVLYSAVTHVGLHPLNATDMVHCCVFLVAGIRMSSGEGVPPAVREEEEEDSNSKGELSPSGQNAMAAAGPGESRGAPGLVWALYSALSIFHGHFSLEKWHKPTNSWSSRQGTCGLPFIISKLGQSFTFVFALQFIVSCYGG